MYKKLRLENIELLRVISMLLILTTHFWGHGINLKSIEPFTFSYYFGWFLKGISYIAVNIYVLISSYFLCVKKFSSQRLLKLWIEVEFYSILIYIISLLLNFQKISVLGIVKAFFPILMKEYYNNLYRISNSFPYI